MWWKCSWLTLLPFPPFRFWTCRRHLFRPVWMEQQPMQAGGNWSPIDRKRALVTSSWLRGHFRRWRADASSRPSNEVVASLSNPPFYSALHAYESLLRSRQPTMKLWRLFTREFSCFRGCRQNGQNSKRKKEGKKFAMKRVYWSIPKKQRSGSREATGSSFFPLVFLTLWIWIWITRDLGVDSPLTFGRMSSMQSGLYFVPSFSLVEMRSPVSRSSWHAKPPFSGSKYGRANLTFNGGEFMCRDFYGPAVFMITLMGSFVFHYSIPREKALTRGRACHSIPGHVNIQIKSDIAWIIFRIYFQPIYDAVKGHLFTCDVVNGTRNNKNGQK